ncbi:MAG: hypothetical protein JWN75_1198 [Candidatus Saccharibacteria bacterium]|nr:hypothetical protein [Candidatus Saccharibacteria bacterium]
MSDAKMLALEVAFDSFKDQLESLRTPLKPTTAGPIGEEYTVMTAQSFDRSLNIAIERAEESVMWAIKHLSEQEEEQNG